MSLAEYESAKVAQLRSLCKERGLNPDGVKGELIARLLDFDSTTDIVRTPEISSVSHWRDADNKSHEEIKELAAIVDEIRYIRKQWLHTPSRHYMGHSSQPSHVSAA